MVSDNDAVKRLYPGFVEALDMIGSTQVQGRCSAGGKLCNASPAADSVPALIVNNVTCNIVGPGGVRQVPAEAFNTGPASNCLGVGEMLVSPTFPPPSPALPAAGD